MDTLKIKLTINADATELDKLEQALDQGDQRAVGAALYSARRELYTLKTLLGDVGTVQLISPEDLDPQILDDLNRQLFEEHLQENKLPFAILDQPPELDEDVLRALNEDWDQAKRGGDSGHER